MRRVIEERPALVALGLLALVVAMRAWLEWVGPLPGDDWSAGIVRHHRFYSGAVFDVITLMAALGTGSVAALSLLAAGWFVWRAGTIDETVFLVAAMGAVLLNGLLKLLLGPTPQFLSLVGRKMSPHNFPSGHTAYAMAFYGALLVIALRHGRRDIAAVFGGLIVLMGVARLAGGFHLVSDVVAGYAVGAAWLLLVYAFGRGRAPASGVPRNE
jgi:undecaprenyl-diphosphatase